VHGFVDYQLKGGRHYIVVEATPQTAGTRALIKQFVKGVKDFERKWHAAAAKGYAQHKAKAKAAGRKRARQVGRRRRG
jgi:hypothetical protein